MNLTAIHSLNKHTVDIAMTGDSTIELNNGWPHYLCDLIDPVWGTCNEGVFPANNPTWTFTTGGNAWTNVTTSDAWDVGVFGPGVFGAGIKRGNTSAKIATWTKPSWLPTVTNWKLYLVDGASAAATSYSIDGGSSWTAIGSGFSGSNSILSFTVADSPITTTLKVRGANSAGTAVNTYLLGLEPTINPLGPTIHNVSSSGESSWAMYRTTAGDWTAWWDLRQPDIAVWQFTNDSAAIWSKSGYETRLNAWIDVIEANGGEVVIISFGEQDGRSVTDQADQRDSDASVAASRGWPYIDMCALWGGSFATADAQGFMNDSLHPSVLGMQSIAAEFWKVISRDPRRAKRLAN